MRYCKIIFFQNEFWIKQDLFEIKANFQKKNYTAIEANWVETATVSAIERPFNLEKDERGLLISKG